MGAAFKVYSWDDFKYTKKKIIPSAIAMQAMAVKNKPGSVLKERTLSTLGAIRTLMTDDKGGA